MMLNAHQIWKAKYAAACLAFHEREIGETAFCVELIKLGFKPHDLPGEINLNYPHSPGVPYR